MSHPAQRKFCERTKAEHPEFFKDKSVLDIGSLDINGNNRSLFENCEYTGIDIGPGLNVDIACPAHEFHGGQFDTVISTEAFEHDPHFEKTLPHIVNTLLKPGGLFLFTCATTGRAEHGTAKASPEDAPFTNDHYRVITEVDVRGVLDIEAAFDRFRFEVEPAHHDLFFWGIKRG